MHSMENLPKIAQIYKDDVEQIREKIREDFKFNEISLVCRQTEVKSDFTLANQNVVLPENLRFSQEGIKRLWKCLRIPEKFSLEIPDRLVLENVNSLLWEKNEMQVIIYYDNNNIIIDAELESEKARTSSDDFLDLISGLEAANSEIFLSQNHLSFNIIFPSCIFEAKISNEERVRYTFGFKIHWNWVRKSNPKAKIVIELNSTGTGNTIGFMTLKRTSMGIRVNQWGRFQEAIDNLSVRIADIQRQIELANKSTIDTKQFVGIYKKIKRMTGDEDFATRHLRTSAPIIDQLSKQNRVIEKVYFASNVSLISTGRPVYPETDYNFSTMLVYLALASSELKGTKLFEIQDYIGDILLNFDKK